MSNPSLDKLCLDSCFIISLEKEELMMRTGHSMFGSGGMNASPSSTRSHWGTAKTFNRSFSSAAFTPVACRNGT